VLLQLCRFVGYCLIVVAVVGARVCDWLLYVVVVLIPLFPLPLPLLLLSVVGESIVI
jgi:hypothetical protein